MFHHRFTRHELHDRAHRIDRSVRRIRRRKCRIDIAQQVADEEAAHGFHIADAAEAGFGDLKRLGRSRNLGGRRNRHWRCGERRRRLGWRSRTGGQRDNGRYDERDTHGWFHPSPEHGTSRKAGFAPSSNHDVGQGGDNSPGMATGWAEWP